MATTLERASFFMGIRGHSNFKVDNPAGIAAGQTITITHPTTGKTVVGTVDRLLPYGSFAMTTTQAPVFSGGLFMPKGSAVA